MDNKRKRKDMRKEKDWNPLGFLLEIENSKEISFCSALEIVVQDRLNGRPDLAHNPVAVRLFGVPTSDGTHIEFGAILSTWLPDYHCINVREGLPISLASSYMTNISKKRKFLAELGFIEASGVEPNLLNCMDNKTRKDIDFDSLTPEEHLKVCTMEHPSIINHFKGLGTLAYVPESPVKPVIIDFFVANGKLAYIYFKITTAMFKRWQDFKGRVKDVTQNDQ